MARALLAGAVLGALVPAGTHVASAAECDPSTERCCTLLPSGRLLCANRDDGGSSTGGGSGSGGGSSPLGRWTSYETDGPEAQVASGVVDCGQDPDGNRVAPWAVELIDNDGEVLALNYVCPSPGGAAPPLPPPPPGPAEVWDQAPLPEPAIGVNPANDGLTGLDTWLWGYDPGPVPLTIELRGYTVSGTALVVKWTWEMGDPAGGYRESTVPGSEANPAATYTYETKGAYTLVHSMYWQASFTVTGHGLPDVPLDAGAVTLTASRPYNVVEVRGVRQPAGTR